MAQFTWNKNLKSVNIRIYSITLYGHILYKLYIYIIHTHTVMHVIYRMSHESTIHGTSDCLDIFYFPDIAWE